LLADAAPLAREERRGDRAGQAEPRHVIAHARALRGRRPLGLAERAHDPRPGPEGGIVEGRALALRALGAVAGEAGVDEAWMHAPERRVVHAERGELLAPEVGQEHVAPPHQRVRHLAPLGAPEIEGHAALATVVELEGGVHVGLVRHQPRGREAAQGVPLRRLGLHHARAPVGEHGGGRGHGDPDAELEHAHAVEGSRHGGLPCHGRAPFCKPAGPCYTARMAEQAQVLGPPSHYFYSQRLKLHYVAWGNADEPPLLLLHGGRDHCRGWDWVAADLRRDFHLVAPDHRGHGDPAWALGSTYSMIDYVLDLAALLQTPDLFPITIIGHSLGARVALQYAGIYSDRVARLVATEALGPPVGLTKPPWAAARRLQSLRAMTPLSRRHPSAVAMA